MYPHIPWSYSRWPASSISPVQYTTDRIICREKDYSICVKHWLTNVKRSLMPICGLTDHKICAQARYLRICYSSMVRLISPSTLKTQAICMISRQCRIAMPASCLQSAKEHCIRALKNNLSLKPWWIMTFQKCIDWQTNSPITSKCRVQSNESHRTLKITMPYLMQHLAICPWMLRVLWVQAPL